MKPKVHVELDGGGLYGRKVLATFEFKSDWGKFEADSTTRRKLHAELRRYLNALSTLDVFLSEVWDDEAEDRQHYPEPTEVPPLGSGAQ